MRMNGINALVAARLVMLVVTLHSTAQAAPEALPGLGVTPLGKQLVAQLQVALLGRNYYHGEIDGLLGSQTQEALYLVQMEHELPLTGSVNEQTLDALSITPPRWLAH